MMLNK